MTTVPCIAREVFDDLGVGAILKRTDSDVKAIVVDIDADGGWPIIVRSKKKIVSGDKPMKGPPHDYVLERLVDLDEWIVLELGGDHLLYE